MYNIFDTYFGPQIRSIYSGIEATMKKETLPLCALALSVYTEVLGGLVTGNLKEKHSPRENYVEFLSYMGQPYVDLHNEIDLYTRIRSKFVHEFSPRPSYIILLSDTVQNRLGIEYVPDKTETRIEDDKPVMMLSRGCLNFWVREYYQDFKKGVEKYRDRLKDEKDPLFMNFIKSLTIRD